LFALGSPKVFFGLNNLIGSSPEGPALTLLRRLLAQSASGKTDKML